MVYYAQAQVREIQNLQTNTKLVDGVKTSEKYTNLVPNKEQDPYPWLARDDSRRDVTNKEILKKIVDLSDSDLTKKKRTV